MRFVLVILALLVSGSIAFAVGPNDTVTGSYHSNYDDVKLFQDGNRIRGTYVCCGGGTIEGKIIEGRTIKYVWRQPSGWGRGVWTIESGHLGGTWGTADNETDGGSWDLKRFTKTQIAQ
jgi:hypothetical protein